MRLDSGRLRRRHRGARRSVLSRRGGAMTHGTGCRADRFAR
jgi:hypothetical protein